MEAAAFVADMNLLPGGARGYEGTFAAGWRPGINRIHSKGDAGLCASIDDLIAWERFIDATRYDVDGVYRRLSKPVTFRDGSPAVYGLGLVRNTRWGRAMTGHGGAIRGWRLHRLVVPAERLSIAIAFNHESNSRDAAMHVLAAALGESDAPAPSDAGRAAAFVGTWLDSEIGILLDVSMNDDGTISAVYDGGGETLSLGTDGVARGLTTVLSQEDGGLRIERQADAICTLAQRVGSGAPASIEGVYYSDELESELRVVNAGGVVFGSFRGPLGQGPMMPMVEVGPNLWRLACRRSLDAPAPGNWTVQMSVSPRGTRMLSLGCWLAREVLFADRT